MGGKMALREKISKETILEAAEKIFSEFGFYNAKIYMIAELAGVSVGTIYRFFRGKDDLYVEVIKKKLNELQKEIDKRMKGKPPTEAINAYISTVVDFFERERSFFTIFSREVGTNSIVTGDSPELSDWYKKHLRKLARVISRGVRSGKFKNLNPMATAIFIAGAIKNSVYARSRGLTATSAEELKELLRELIFEGMVKHR